jgi:hypothetical protein
MIAHQHIRMHQASALCSEPSKALEVEAPVYIAEKTRRAIYPSLNNMERYSRKL